MTVKKRNTSKKRKNFQRTVKVTTKAYKDRERACSYKDYLMLITLANFNLHQIRHLQINKFHDNNQIEMELLKRWSKLPIEERNRFENEAIDNDIFHQIAYIRILNQESFDSTVNIEKELKNQWNTLPNDEKIVHKRVATNRDIEMRRFF